MIWVMQSNKYQSMIDRFLLVISMQEYAQTQRNGKESLAVMKLESATQTWSFY